MSDDTFDPRSIQGAPDSPRGASEKKPTGYSARSASLTRVAEKSHGKRASGNMIIQGDNLEVLEAIMPNYAARLRCIYIDPPYNNQERHLHYKDSCDHQTWLRNIAARLRLLRDLLRPDGSLWISIDDRELHYLKVVADMIFGRDNFVHTIVWQQRTTRENRKAFSNNHEYILVYARDRRLFKKALNGLPATNALKARYKNPDNDPRGSWQSVSANVQAGHATAAQFYVMTGPDGRKHAAPKGRCWVYSQSRMKEEIAKHNVWFGAGGGGVPRLKRFLSAARQQLTPDTLWLAQDVGTNDAAKKHVLQLMPRIKVFDTPKPESLIHRILQLATSPGDIVLDAYAGCGTTAAVAHKTKRRYIIIEEGSHAVTHCVCRMRHVIAGEQGGISGDVGWKGGGGFDFFRLV